MYFISLAYIKINNNSKKPAKVYVLFDGKNELMISSMQQFNKENSSFDDQRKLIYS